MRKKQLEVTSVLEDILCDICGSTVIPRGVRQHVDNVNDFSAYGTLTASFGYGSARDGEEFQFDFCESCFDEVLSHVIKLQSL